MAKVNFIRRKTNEEVDDIPIADGNFIVTGEGKAFVDYDNERHGLGGTPDTEMNDNSTNTVENKVIKKYVDALGAKVGSLDSLSTTNKDSIVGAIDELNNPKNTILWEGGYYMTEGQTANLKQKISDQKHGIVLVWTNYSSGEVQNNGVNCFFVPKKYVELYPNQGFGMLMIKGWDGNIGKKYVYIGDEKITGHQNNNKVATENGINWVNNQYVLRYVIGV